MRSVVDDAIDASCSATVTLAHMRKRRAALERGGRLTLGCRLYDGRD